MPEQNYTVAAGYGSLPGPDPARKIGGGTVSIAQTPGLGPDDILPITPAADASVYTTDQFEDYMWRPLWWSPLGATPEIDYSQSIAKQAVFSDDGRTVTITLDPDWKWSDGQRLTSEDVLFDIDLTEAAVKLGTANYGGYTAGLYPDLISSMSAPSPTTVVLHLDKTYNQNFLALDELAQIVPIPAHAWAKEDASGAVLSESAWFDPDPSRGTDLRTDEAIYEFLDAQSKDLATYAENPLWQVVDGPFHLTSFDATTGANTMAPNPNYTGPVKPSIGELENVAFTSDSAEFDQLLSGRLTVGYVDPSHLRQIDDLARAGYTVWGYPDFGFSYVAYNFKDQTGHFADVIKQLYFRQALAHLQNGQEAIKSADVFDGAAAPSYGPVPVAPESPFLPQDARFDPYPYSPMAAASILRSHGWNVVREGTTTCAHAGSAAGECGEGIPEGTPLSWTLLYGFPATVGAEVQQFALNAQLVGIRINLVQPDTIFGEYSDVDNGSDEDAWAMQDFGGFTDSDYPTTNQIFDTTGAYNVGGYSDPTADALIEDSVTSLDPHAVDNEISYLVEQQPALFEPNGDLVLAFKDDLHGPSSSFADASQYQYSPEYWYFTK